MTNDLEKQFFDTFGIEPREFKSCDVGTFCPYPEKECGTDICPYYRTYQVDYPAISDRILLELICILNSVSVEFKSECIEDLKREILGEITILLEYAPNEETAEFIKHSVQALFEEGK